MDPDSKLAVDLDRLKKENGQDHILFSFTFSNEFPFKPPFVRVISPGKKIKIKFTIDCLFSNGKKELILVQHSRRCRAKIIIELLH